MSRGLADRGLTKGEAAAEQILTQAHAFVEEWILRALPPRDVPPTRLHGAMHDAVFPGGRRARPLLCRLIADRYGGGEDEMVGRMAAALELVHCASLVQDDLPCFDDADTRRADAGTVGRILLDTNMFLTVRASMTREWRTRWYGDNRERDRRNA